MGNTRQQNVTEEYLIKLLKSKDKRLMPILYEKYAPSLFGVIHSIVKHQETAEEQLNECFLKIWKYSSKYDPSKGRLFTWMLQIARNCAIDATKKKDFRNQSEIQNIENAVYTIDKTNFVETKVDEIGIKELIEELNTKYKQVINMYFFEGYKQQEVANKLDIPLGTVKTRIKKALGLLKKYL